MQDASRREPSRLAYGFFRPIEDERELVAVELWASRPALDAHFSTPHLTDFTSRLAALAERPPAVKLHEVASTVALPPAVTNIFSEGEGERP